MGIFHYRCVATGLPLTHGRVVMVAVRETSDGKWAPVSLPIHGSVDGYGGMEGVAADFRVTVLANALEEAARGNRVVALNEAGEALERGRPLSPVGALHVIERATSMAEWEGDRPGLRVDGQRVQQVYFKKDVFDAIAKEAGVVPKREPSPDEVRAGLALFEDPLGASMHRDLHKLLGETRRKVIGAVNELRALQTWMTAHQVQWRNGPTGQFGHGDTLEAILKARVRFADNEQLRSLLNREASALERTVEEDDPLEGAPSKWSKHIDVSCFAVRVGEKRWMATSMAELRALIIREAVSAPTDQHAPADVLSIEHGLVVARHELRPLIARGPELGPALDELEQQLAPLKGAATKNEAVVLADPAPWGGFMLRTFSRS